MTSSPNTWDFQQSNDFPVD